MSDLRRTLEDSLSAFRSIRQSLEKGEDSFWYQGVEHELHDDTLEARQALAELEHSVLDLYTKVVILELKS